MRTLESQDWTEYLDVLGFEPRPWSLPSEAPPLTLNPSNSGPLDFRGPLSARVVFLGEGLQAGSEASVLLDRMVAAMGWTPPEVLVVNLPQGIGPTEFPAGIEARVWILLGETARASVAFPGPPGRVLAHPQRAGISALATNSLQDLLRDPGLKKDAWNDLKLVIAHLG